MSITITDPTLLAQLLQTGGVTEIHDPSGQLIGRFQTEPFKTAKQLLEAGGPVQIVDEKGNLIALWAPILFPHSSAALRKESHSIMDIPTLSLGAVMQTLGSNDDLLGEMLEGRK